MEKERRTKALVVVVLLIVVAGLTVAFAALSTTLNINGTAYLDAAKWGIKFENLSSPTKIGSATTTGTAKIEETKAAEITGINVNLSTPGDKVTYTVDLVNKGTINTKIDNIEKTQLTSEQQRYLTFKVTDKSGNEVSEGDILSAGETRNLTITIEFIKDLTKEDLPTSTSTISLSYKLNFVQTDEKATSAGQDLSQACTSFKKKDKYDVGDVISVCNSTTGKSEDFYVMADLGAEHVLAMAKYPLLYGYDKYITVISDNNYTSESYKPISTNTKNYGLQSSELTYDAMSNPSDSVMEYFSKYCMDSDGNFINAGTKECTDVYFSRGGVKFAEGKYFSDIANQNTFNEKGFNSSTYDLSGNIYEHTNVYTYSKEYQNYLVSLGMSSAIVSIPDMSQMKALGCTGIGTGFCPSTVPSWVKSSIYWLNYCSSNRCYYTSDGEESNSTIEDNYHPFRPIVSFKRSEL